MQRENPSRYLSTGALVALVVAACNPDAANAPPIGASPPADFLTAAGVWTRAPHFRQHVGGIRQRLSPTVRDRPSCTYSVDGQAMEWV